MHSNTVYTELIQLFDLRVVTPLHFFFTPLIIQIKETMYNSNNTQKLKRKLAKQLTFHQQGKVAHCNNRFNWLGYKLLY